MAYLQFLKDYKDKFNSPTLEPVKSAIYAIGVVMNAEEHWSAEVYDCFFAFYIQKIRELNRTLLKVLKHTTNSQAYGVEANKFVKDIYSRGFLRRINNYKAYWLIGEFIGVMVVTININDRIHQLDWRIREVLKETNEIVLEMAEEISNYFHSFKYDPDFYSIVSKWRN